MALFDTNSGLGGLLGNLGDYGFGLPSNTGGLIPDEERDAINKRALMSGLISAGLTYAATPKNLNTGSALPYLGRAGLAGFGASQDVVDRSLNAAYRNQILAARDNKDQLYTIDGALVDRTGNVVYQAPKETRGQASQSSDIQLLNRYNETFANYQKDPKNPLLRNEVKALELKLGLQQPPAAPQTQAEIVKKNLTPLQAKVEEKSAQDLVDFTVGGGFSDVQKGLTQLENAKQVLQQQPEGKITGKVVGVQDDTGLLKYTNPVAQDTKEQVQEIAQRNLRLILGPQFTAKEGEALINRVYNPALPQSVNVKRLELLQEQMSSAAKTKQEAVEYYNANGTLKGFTGKIYNNTSDFISDYNNKLKSVEKTPEAKPSTTTPFGFKEGAKTKSKSGKPMVYRNGQWEYE
jgi:hypothetical protein